jgi:hypothetical protein
MWRVAECGGTSEPDFGGAAQPAELLHRPAEQQQMTIDGQVSEVLTLRPLDVQRTALRLSATGVRGSWGAGAGPSAPAGLYGNSRLLPPCMFGVCSELNSGVPGAGQAGDPWAREAVS